MRRRRRKPKFAGQKIKKKVRLNLANLRSAGKWIFKIAVVCLLAYVSVWYFGQRVSMIGDSMKPVLSNADVVLVNRIVYNATTPKRGDIIAFKPKGNENAHYYIKRIIGLPGETVQVKNGEVYIDGEILGEDYGAEAMEDAGIASDPIELGTDEYFVLGDNRNHSSDSRDPSVGVLRREDLIGRAWIRIYPFDEMGFVVHE